MTRSTSKKSASPPPKDLQTLEQYLASQPSVYVVAENLHPKDLWKTKGEEGYRILGVFLTLETANEYARKYAYGLKKWDDLPKGTSWTEDELSHTGGVDAITESINNVDGTAQYVVAWSHFTTVKVARWSVRDAAPTVDSNTAFFDRVDFVADDGAADSVYEESDDDEEEEEEEDDDESDDEDSDDVKMEDLRDELQGLAVDRKKNVKDLARDDYVGQ